MKKSYLIENLIISIFLILISTSTPAFAQIAENLRNEQWIEAGGNSLITNYFSPKYVEKNGQIFSTIVKWNYKKTINNKNSSVGIIKINCQNQTHAQEYLETYSELNLKGRLIDGGRFPGPLEWQKFEGENAYAELKNIICN